MRHWPFCAGESKKMCERTHTVKKQLSMREMTFFEVRLQISMQVFFWLKVITNAQRIRIHFMPTCMGKFLFLPISVSLRFV